MDVPDATDWLGTPLAGLHELEQTLRCRICKDFFNSPVLTSCNHTFCSACIRRTLSVNNSRCPTCQAEDQATKLRGNWAMRDAVEAFQKHRNAILSFTRAAMAQTQPPVKAPAHLSETSTDSGSPFVEVLSPKRKSPMTLVVEDLDPKRPRLEPRASRTKALAALLSNSDSTESKEPAFHSGETHSLRAARSFAKNADDALVECPCCGQRMRESRVNQHLDKDCPVMNGSTLSASSSNTSLNFLAAPTSTSIPAALQPPKQKPPERLAPLAYSMLKDHQLRKKMADLGLPTTGSRQMLERRHQEWVTLWNANCDSARPKSRAELLRELDVWERTQGSLAPTHTRAALSGAQIKDKNFDRVGWMAKYRDMFRELTEQARASMEKAKKGAEEKKEGSAPAQSTVEERGEGLAEKTAQEIHSPQAEAPDEEASSERLPESEVVPETPAPEPAP
ncbi:uncharacterized protein CTHT_0039180 [Thermochaetoides thermophila DSM 1495]|uniref:Postreplication repair E3 ubiquitin-protein ligase RAD18 n=1 Tax=Chaetomium thermophilum (strain DSM 1495 / CBS 144.50 / IMI 039719) TaxID=759272 RepID=G0S3X1_CHATD|nr:hypothetical protein CTHT_0039180 [Thermochaetoides thermophila DSM 1495]EGS22033.1 hypothetical protein CTHT_0039180 [Thermochaetoides thermophila DSM 1495]